MVSTQLNNISEIGSFSPRRGDHKTYLSCHHLGHFGVVFFGGGFKSQPAKAVAALGEPLQWTKTHPRKSFTENDVTVVIWCGTYLLGNLNINRSDMWQKNLVKFLQLIYDKLAFEAGKEISKTPSRFILLLQLGCFSPPPSLHPPLDGCLHLPAPAMR